MRMKVRSLASLNELRIWRCHELWCRLQMRLGPALLWLWHGPLAWELTNATEGECSPKKERKKKVKPCSSLPNIQIFKLERIKQENNYHLPQHIWRILYRKICNPTKVIWDLSQMYWFRSKERVFLCFVVSENEKFSGETKCGRKNILHKYPWPPAFICFRSLWELAVHMAA